jgi:hypothetical protein
MQIHDGAIGRLDFFSGKDPEFLSNIVPLLMPLKVEEGEFLYHFDQFPYEIFFVIKGKINFIIEKDELILKQWN